jgi:hypothetical protein
MNIISTTKHSRQGNDCLINDSYHLCEEYGMYFVLKVTKVVGWPDYKDISVVCNATPDRYIAEHAYTNVGGVL